MTLTLAGATIIAADLSQAIDAYGAFLDYRPRGVEKVGRERAERWGAPGAADARMADLYPESGEDRFIRLIEGQPAPNYRPLVSPGWAAAEIVVQDVEALAITLRDSPFRIIGEPAILDFDFTDKIKAMQVLGPCGEVLYFTQIDGDVPGFALPKARSRVGQLFIMVMAANAIPEAQDQLACMGGVTGPEFEARIEILSDAFSLPREMRHRLTTVGFDGETYVEIDLLPDGASPRPLADVGVPSGIAMASFRDGDSVIDLIL